MGKLTMKTFGEGDKNNPLDFSSLEFNSKFKPEEGEDKDLDENEEESSEEDLEDQNQDIDDLKDNSEEDDDSKELEDKGGETPDTNASDIEDIDENKVITLSDSEQDDLIFKKLSEKLGKEIKDYNDLIQEPAKVELDPQIEALNKWMQETGRPIQDFFKYQKDYSTVSDIDIAREVLQLEYPNFTEEEINLELENFLPSDEDLDREIAKKSLELKKYATKGRDILNKLKMELGQPTNNLAPEIKQKLDFAEQVQKQIDSNKAYQEEYQKSILKVSESTDSMKLALDDKLSIDFKMSPEGKKSIPDLINNMPHWKNPDGSFNHKAVVEDAIKIKYFDDMIKLAYEQGVNSGKDSLLKETRNITLDKNIPDGSQQIEGNKKPLIENIDKVLGNQKLKMRFS